MSYKLAPSILSADFSALGREINTIAEAGAHYVHFDVMDGHFVPNLSFGVPVLRSIRPLTKLIYDVHLMIEKPFPYLDMFAEAGADIINVHLESDADISACLNRIHQLGKRAAVTVKPSTSAEAVFGLMEYLDMVLVMSVEPGFGGQSFIPDSLDKAEKLANFAQAHGLTVDIEMDGGIGLHNVSSVLAAGVNVIVAGSAVFARTPEETAHNVRAFLNIFEN